MSNWSGTYSITTPGTTSTGSNTSNTFKNTGATWPTGANSLSNFWIRILSGTGSGQTVQVSSNTATVATMATNWGTIPDATSTYEIVLILADQDHIVGSITLSTNIITELVASATILVDGNYSIALQGSCTVRWNMAAATLVTFCANNRTVVGLAGFWAGFQLISTLSVKPLMSYLKFQDANQIFQIAINSTGAADLTGVHHLWYQRINVATTFTGAATQSTTLANCLVTNVQTSSVINFPTSNAAFTLTYNSWWVENTSNVMGVGWTSGTSINTKTLQSCVFSHVGPGSGTGQSASTTTYNLLDSYVSCNTGSGSSALGNSTTTSQGVYNAFRNVFSCSGALIGNAIAAGATIASAFNDVTSPLLAASNGTPYTNFIASAYGTATSDNDYISGQNSASETNVDTSASTTSTASPHQYQNLTATRTNAKAVLNMPFVIDNVVVGTPTSYQVGITFDCQNGAVSGQGSSTVNVDSNSGQAVLSIPTTTGFQVGETVEIGYGTARAENLVILSIQAATSLTFTANLAFTHTSAQADTVKKRLRRTGLPFIRYGTASGVYTMGTVRPPETVWGLIYTGIQPIQNGQSFAFNYTGHSLTLVNLKPGTTYYFTPYAIDPLGNLISGSESSFSTAGVTVAGTFS